jgi:predicted dehydrogenase
MLSINALTASGKYRLIGVADTSEAARSCLRLALGEEVGIFAGHEEMFDACPADVVCVSTYAPTHLDIATAAMQGPVRGLLVEKPLGDSSSAGRCVVDRAKAKGLPLVVPHGLMAQAAPLDIVSRVGNGVIGDLRCVEMECTGWDIINAGIHWLQFFVALVHPEPVEVVLAACDTSTRTYRDGMEVETEAITMGRCASGVRVLLNTGDDVPIANTGTVCLMRIIGDRGFIEYAAWESSYRLVADGHDRELVEVEPFPVSGHRRHLEYLADQIHTGSRDYIVPETSLHALEIVEAAYESHRVGATVRLPWSGKPPEAAGPWDPGSPYPGTGGGQDGRRL